MSAENRHGEIWIGEEPGYFERRRRDQVADVIQIRYGPPLDPIDGEPMDRGPRWEYAVNGRVVEVLREPMPCWSTGKPITEAYARYLLADRDWLKQHATLDRPTLASAPAPF